jgi:uncharacterized membrane protein YphA (DoxX/SURF4 family)
MRIIITIIRVAIGWHFLYEGISKMFAGNWTSQYYLSSTSGFLSGFYHWLAATPAVMKVVELMNIYGLILIGTSLFLGLFVRWAALGGTLLLALYYFAYPPLVFSLPGTGEGFLFVVDKIFIEVTVLVFFFFYKGKGFGIDKLIRMLRKKGKSHPLEEGSNLPEINTRREALKNLAVIPALGIMGFSAYESGKRYDADVNTSTRK